MKKNPNIWSHYNPRAYLMKLVRWEDTKRYLGKELYDRKTYPDFDPLTKKSWRARLKNFGSMMMV